MSALARRWLVAARQSKSSVRRRRRSRDARDVIVARPHYSRATAASSAPRSTNWWQRTARAAIPACVGRSTSIRTICFERAARVAMMRACLTGGSKMAQDFANGQRHKRAPRSDSRSRPRQRQSAFHWGSFGAGIALGIAFTLAGALLPEWWGSSRPAAIAQAPVASDSTPVTRFEFFERLPNEKISSRPEPAETATAPPVGRRRARVSVAGRIVHEQRRRRTVARHARAIGLEHGDRDRHVVERGHPPSGDRRPVRIVAGNATRDQPTPQAGRRRARARA